MGEGILQKDFSRDFKKKLTGSNEAMHVKEHGIYQMKFISDLAAGYLCSRDGRIKLF